MYYYHCKRWLHLYNWWKSLTHFLRNGIFHEVKISERCVANLAWFLWLQIRSLSASRYWSLPALCSRNVQRPNPSPAEQNRTFPVTQQLTELFTAHPVNVGLLPVHLCAQQAVTSPSQPLHQFWKIPQGFFLDLLKGSVAAQLLPHIPLLETLAKSGLTVLVFQLPSGNSDFLVSAGARDFRHKGFAASHAADYKTNRF